MGMRTHGPHEDGHTSINRSAKEFCFSQEVLIGTQPVAAAEKKTPVNQWTMEELCTFFAAQELDVYIAAIKREKVDGRMLLDLIAEDALEELGITSTVHKLRIKRGLEAATDDRPKVAGAEAVVSRSSDVSLP